MKFNFQSLAYLLISGLIGFTSCKKDDEKSVTPEKVLPTSFTAKLVGAQSNAAGSFFSPKTGLVYFTGDSASFIASGVDISFAQTGSPSTSPKFVSLSERKEEGLTRVRTLARLTNFSTSTLTKAQFDTVGNIYIQEEVLGTSPTVTISQSKVYEFTNAEGKSGLIYVSNLDLGTANATTGLFTNGAVTIDVKFEK
jgi:hypothetical protein